MDSPDPVLNERRLKASLKVSSSSSGKMRVVASLQCWQSPCPANSCPRKRLVAPLSMRRPTISSLLAVVASLVPAYTETSWNLLMAELSPVWRIKHKEEQLFSRTASCKALLIKSSFLDSSDRIISDSLLSQDCEVPCYVSYIVKERRHTTYRALQRLFMLTRSKSLDMRRKLN